MSLTDIMGPITLRPRKISGAERAGRKSQLIMEGYEEDV
jgi:hypothetical protein